jgi:hypothetical protein
MRGRGLILGVVTTLVAVLGFSSAAHADPERPTVSFDCTSQNQVINCRAMITSDPAGGPVEIVWRVGSMVQASSTNTVSFRCTKSPIFSFDAAVTISISQRFSGQTLTNFAFREVVCDDPISMTPRRLFPIFCQLARTGGLPGGLYFICDILWKSTDSQATVQWVSPGAQRQPVVSTDSTYRRSQAVFDCNVYSGGPDFTFTAFVRVTDASGTMTTPATIPCGW